MNRTGKVLDKTMSRIEMFLLVCHDACGNNSLKGWQYDSSLKEYRKTFLIDNTETFESCVIKKDNGYVRAEIYKLEESKKIQVIFSINEDTEFLPVQNKLNQLKKQRNKLLKKWYKRAEIFVKLYYKMIASEEKIPLNNNLFHISTSEIECLENYWKFTLSAKDVIVLENYNIYINGMENGELYGYFEDIRKITNNSDMVKQVA